MTGKVLERIRNGAGNHQAVNDVTYNILVRLTPTVVLSSSGVQRRTNDFGGVSQSCGGIIHRWVC